MLKPKFTLGYTEKFVVFLEENRLMIPNCTWFEVWKTILTGVIFYAPKKVYCMPKKKPCMPNKNFCIPKLQKKTQPKNKICIPKK
jgi:hypothetical protein